MNLKKSRIYRNIFGHKKTNFIYDLQGEVNILDIGCGNHSPSTYKKINPKINYFGIDIAEYNMDEEDYRLANKIIYVDRSSFASSIKSLGANFDVVISAHNLEHTDEPTLVLEAMMECLRKGGILYLSFPTESSTKFPSRKGTLNFYDDSTHSNLPNFKEVCTEILRQNGKIIYKKKKYRTIYGFFKGLLQEPFSAFNKRLYSGTWHFWGFETIIIAEKL